MLLAKCAPVGVLSFVHSKLCLFSLDCDCNQPRNRLHSSSRSLEARFSMQIRFFIERLVSRIHFGRQKAMGAIRIQKRGCSNPNFDCQRRLPRRKARTMTNTVLHSQGDHVQCQRLPPSAAAVKNPLRVFCGEEQMRLYADV